MLYDSSKTGIVVNIIKYHDSWVYVWKTWWNSEGQWDNVRIVSVQNKILLKYCYMILDKLGLW